MSKVEGVRVFIFYFVRLGNLEHAFRSCLVGDCVLACVRKVTHCWHCCWRFAKKVTHCWHRCSHCVRRSLFKPFRRIIQLRVLLRGLCFRDVFGEIIERQ